MTSTLPDHPVLPKDCTAVLSHSNFGSEVGYSHYIHKDEQEKGVYYLGLVLNDKHGGAPGRGHGGVTMAMLDEVMGRAASRAIGKMCYTASMTTNFCSGSAIGDHLLATATVSRSGKTLVFVDAELHAGGRLVATATGSWINSGKDVPQASELS